MTKAQCVLDEPLKTHFTNQVQEQFYYTLQCGPNSLYNNCNYGLSFATNAVIGCLKICTLIFDLLLFHDIILIVNNIIIIIITILIIYSCESVSVGCQCGNGNVNKTVYNIQGLSHYHNKIDTGLATFCDSSNRDTLRCLQVFKVFD